MRLTFSRSNLLGGAAIVGATALLAGCASTPTLSVTTIAAGENAENDHCRAVETKNDVTLGATAGAAYYLYCGQWERPAARLFALGDQSEIAAGAAFRARLESECVELASQQVSLAGFATSEHFSCTARADDLGRSEISAIPSFVTFATMGGRGFAAEGVASSRPAVERALNMLASGVPAGDGAPPAEASSGDPIEQLEQSARQTAADGSLGTYQANADLGDEYNGRWRFRAAEAAYLDALAAHQRAAPADLSGRAQLLGEIGLNLSNQGRFDEALAQLSEADRLAEAAQREELAITGTDLRASFVRLKVALYQAQHFANARDFDAALELQARVDAALTARAERIGPAAGEDAGGGPEARNSALAQPVVLIDRSTSRALGAPEDLRDPFTLGARALTDRQRLAVLRAQSAYLRAAMLQRLGRPGAAESLEHADAFLNVAPLPTAMWLRAVVAQERARLALAAGAPQNAEQILVRALSQYRQTAQDSRLEAILLVSLARARAGAGDRDAALLAYEEAFSIYRRQLEEPGASAAQALEFVRLLLDNQGPAAPGDEARAFVALQTVVEPSVARTIALMSARAELGEGGASVRSLQDADRAVGAARAALAVAVARGATQSEQDQLAALHEQAQQRRTAAEERVRVEAPAYLRLIAIDSSVPAIADVLGEQEAFLQVALDSQGGYGVLVTKSGVRTYRIALSDADAARLVARIRQTLGGGLQTYDIDGARALYRALLEPIEAELRAANVRAITYALPSALANLPLGATLAEDAPEAAHALIQRYSNYSTLHWAARDFDFTQAVSASSFVSLRSLGASSGARAFVGFGDFLPARPSAERVADIVGSARLPANCRTSARIRLTSLPPLPGTRAELQSAVNLFGGSSQATLRLGAAFTDESVLGESGLRDARVISFATHGLLAEDSCFTEPALLTSLSPVGGDGFLDTSEILQLRLDADLVVLTACDTAMGGGNSGEAFGGLARAFFYAGARSLLASHWRINDRATAQLMRGFFEHAQSGEPVSAALAKSQRRLLAQPDTSHPVFWAPLVVVGDGGRRIRHTPPD